MRRLKLTVLFVFRAIGLFFVARWLTRRKLKIICFHGFQLHDECAFRPKLFMSPETLERRLKSIRRYRLRVLPLDDAVRLNYSGGLPEHALVITIDDGFQSVHQVAMPKLRVYGYAATVYVTTYYVQNQNPIFRLVVQYMFWKSKSAVADLSGASWSRQTQVSLFRASEVEKATWDCIHFGETHCSENQRMSLCEDLGHRLGVPLQEILASRKLHLMNVEQLQSLASAGVNVQLHTHRHRFPADDAELASKEIFDNRRALSEMVDGDLKHFCYPSGQWHQKQWAWLDAMGVASSTTCLPGLNSIKTPRHAMRRFLDGENIHQLEFEAAICGLPDLLRSLRLLTPTEH